MTDTPPAQAAAEGDAQGQVLRALDETNKALTANNAALKWIHRSLDIVRDQLLQQEGEALARDHANPLNRFGRKCFSQADEDGITMEIVRRLGIERGLFAEFGVGDGGENNTLILAALGWEGFWVGGQKLAFDPTGIKRLKFTQDFITLDNIADHARAGAAHFGGRNPDVISLDLDGNDLHFVAHLLEQGFQPRLFVVEYNGKFPPPVRFVMPYNPAHQWRRDDYFGASLTSYVEMFARFGYRLVCCNAQTGSDAFFVREADMGLFADVPTDIDQLYMPPRYRLYNAYGHKTAIRTVEALLRA